MLRVHGVGADFQRSDGPLNGRVDGRVVLPPVLAQPPPPPAATSLAVPSETTAGGSGGATAGAKAEAEALAPPVPLRRGTSSDPSVMGATGPIPPLLSLAGGDGDGGSPGDRHSGGAGRADGPAGGPSAAGDVEKLDATSPRALFPRSRQKLGTISAACDVS